MKNKSIEEKNTRFYFLFLWILFLILGFLAFREFLAINILEFVPASDLFQSKRFIAFLMACILTTSAWLVFFFLQKNKFFTSTLEYVKSFPGWLRAFPSLIALVLPALLKWIFPQPENFFLGPWTMVFLFTCASIFSEKLLTNNTKPAQRLLTTAVFFMVSGFGYSVCARLDQVTSYPFTMYWSEGNRFFDYSTLLGSFRYIVPQGKTIKAFISWGMALPWSIPFLIPNLSIGAFRSWNQLVWILPAFLLGFTAVKKNGNKQNTLIAILFGFWAYLFIDQGPVYIPLLFGAIITILAVRVRLPLGVLLIIIASYYVRNSRWIWGYAPGIWAGLLSLLAIENPQFKKGRLKDLIKPVALGLAGYFGGHLLPITLNVITKGTELALIPNPSASVTRQPLIWERLWPNPTYPPGIVLGLLWATLPVLIFLIILIAKRFWKLNWMQKLSTLVVCGAFLFVGVVASTKIGGGSNLHNADMFILSLLFVFSAAINTLLRSGYSENKFKWIWTVPLIICLISPVTYALQKGERMELPPAEKIQESMNAVQNKVEEYSTKGEILFIDHRQLLTFQLVKNVPLIDDYEKKYLMDNAMTGDTVYFEQFYSDLISARFVLIVNEPSNLISRGSDYNFGDENDAYVKWVTAPLLCTYEPLYTSQATAVELLVPRTSPAPEYLGCEEILSDSRE